MGKISGEYLNEKYQLGASQALYRGNGTWFHALSRFPGILCDTNGYVLFESEEEYKNSSPIKHGPNPKHIHVIDGIDKLPNYKRFIEPDSAISQKSGQSNGKSRDFRTQDSYEAEGIHAA